MIDEDNKTLWCGNLSEQVTEELLYELFLQAGPLEKVRIAKDRDGRQKTFAFITYCHEVSVPYALQLFRGTALFHRTLSLQARGRLACLPPPIRCYGPEVVTEMHPPNSLSQEFFEMTEKLKGEDFIRPPPLLHHEHNRSHSSSDKLVMASLQGNWSHRHHPYRVEDNHSYRSEYKPGNFSENHNSGRNKHKNNWRERRNYKKGNNYHGHRRE